MDLPRKKKKKKPLSVRKTTYLRVKYRMRRARQQHGTTFFSSPAAIVNRLGDPPGKLTTWTIDHVLPLHLFDLSVEEQFEIAFSPENHQWMKDHENWEKSVSFPSSIHVRLIRALEMIMSNLQNEGFCKSKEWHKDFKVDEALCTANELRERVTARIEEMLESVRANPLGLMRLSPGFRLDRPFFSEQNLREEVRRRV